MSGKNILTKEAAQAMMNLRGSQDWVEIARWLGDLTSKYLEEQMMAQTGEQALRMASRARAFSQITDAIKQAPQLIDELKKGYR